MEKTGAARYGIIDAARAVAVINMIAFHFVYDCFTFAGDWERFSFNPAAIVWERFICVSFIAISGVSLHFSKHPYRRGIILNLCGLLITAVTLFAVPGQAVWFGVLNLIGCSMMICAALRPLLDKLEPVFGTVASVLLFGVFYGVPTRWIGFFDLKLIRLPDFFYQFKYVAFLGFPDSGFRSSDYFPIITWIFVYSAGYFLWGIIEKYQKQELFRRGLRPLSFIGRHSLIFYLAHQPVLYGAAYLIFHLGG